MRIFFFLFILLTSTTSDAQKLPLNLLKTPPHFTVEIYAAPIQNAREMALGSNNTLFVGSLIAGNVYAVVPDKNSPHGTRVLTIASGLQKPNGVAFRDGALYVAESTRIIRFDAIETHLTNPPKPVVVTTILPNKPADHDWHFIRFAPDGKLYIGVGAPCNECLPDDPRYATIMRMNPDGSQLEVYVKGVRNSVGFDWNPQTQQLWFTDNGRDWMGDNLPPDELNYAPHKDMNFGYPYCHGINVPDPTYGKIFPCSRFTPPTLELPAHVAPLGMSFYIGKMFPSDYQNQIFLAEHGSWNRSKKIGYQVIAVKLNGNQVSDVKPFISGWLQSQTNWGRPVATLVMPDGSLLVSDDFANVIYRVTYK